jgi:bla regulator protein blaR1
MIPTYLMPLANHLWQSTAFAGTVALLCFALRKHQAAIRFWLWLAASVKFLIPLSWLIDFSSRLQPTAVSTIGPPPFSSVMKGISQPFALPAPAPLLSSVPNAASLVPAILLSIWACGFAASALCWLRAWLRMRSAVRCASINGAGAITTPTGADSGPAFQRIKVMVSSLQIEPCVFGIFRPVLLIPSGIGGRLTHEQLEAIFLHELSHVRRRDNLTAAIHMVTETVFWFFPLIYWIGQRLMNERESACDEEVLRVLPKPEAYAQGILAVCRFAVQGVAVCAAGVTGPNLKRRIEAIMECRTVPRLNSCRKLFLAATLGAVIGGPFWTGVLFVRASRAQSQSGVAGAAPFAVASIKPNRSGERNSGFRRFTGGQLDARNITVRMLISFAYDLPQERILQGPAWLDSERYDILAKPDQPTGQPVDQSMGVIRLRTEALLADRFKLILHKETRQLPIFRLVVDKNGPKNLQPPKSNSSDLVTNGHHVSCYATSMASFAKNFLVGQVGGPVIDETGIQGNFDFSMDWTADDNSPKRPGDSSDPSAPSELNGPSFFSALREQLGLKFEAGKGPVEVVIIEHAERAAEN